MLNWIRRYWPALLLVVALLWIMDAVISSAITCHPDSNAAANQQAQPEGCSITDGPILVSLVAIAGWLQDKGQAVIAAFTVILTLSTIALWSATRDSTRIAERVLTELEAPFVSVKISSPGIELKNGGRSITFGYLKWRVVNHGRTPATILEIFDDVRQVDEGQGLPAVAAPTTDIGSPMPYGIIAPPNGESEDFPYLALGAILEQGETNPAISKKNGFFIGYIRYSDILKNRFILGFCFFFERHSNRWILAGGNEYNYCPKDDFPPPPGWYEPTSDPRSVRADLYRSMRMHGGTPP